MSSSSNETESRAEFTDEEAISGLLEQAQAANEIIEDFEAENAHLRSELSRVEAMLSAATGIDFMIDDLLLPDVRLSKADDGKWYVSLDGTVFIETGHGTAVEAFESQEGE